MIATTMIAVRPDPVADRDRIVTDETALRGGGAALDYGWRSARAELARWR